MTSEILWTDETKIKMYPKSSSNKCRFKVESGFDVSFKANPKFSSKLLFVREFCLREVTLFPLIDLRQNINAKF